MKLKRIAGIGAAALVLCGLVVIPGMVGGIGEAENSGGDVRGLIIIESDGFVAATPEDRRLECATAVWVDTGAEEHIEFGFKPLANCFKLSLSETGDYHVVGRDGNVILVTPCSDC